MKRITTTFAIVLFTVIGLLLLSLFLGLVGLFSVLMLLVARAAIF